MNHFKHGVASGDPLSDRVIIWTKISDVSEESHQVRYEVATQKKNPEQAFENIIQEGLAHAKKGDNYTVKVDVLGLEPSTNYFYRFIYQEQISPIGSTKTAPSDDDLTPVRFATVCCSHIQDNYFTAYKVLAKRGDIDFVIHLGDSIYEYGPNHKINLWPNDKYFRPIHIPSWDNVTLEDYRERYCCYLTDPDLQLVNSRYPFYFTWDDHEIADNASLGGANNHDPSKQGDWTTRFEAARKAWFEYHPVRGETIFRHVRYGKLISMTILDERSYKDPQKDKRDVRSSSSHNNSAPRTMLGNDQKEFLKANLLNENALWHLIANPLMFSETLLKIPIPKCPVFNWFRNKLKLDSSNRMIIDMDQWDGYPEERNEIRDFIKKNNIKNCIFLTGDLHVSTAGSIKYRFEEEENVGVEIVTPSISSDNLNEFIHLKEGNLISKLVTHILKESNPHLRILDTDRHGYVIFDINKQFLKGDFWFLKEIRNPHSDMEAIFSLKVFKDTNRLLLLKDK